MIRSLLFFSFVLFLCGWKNPVSEKKLKFVEEDFLSAPCAVFVAPTSNQIDSLKQKMGADVFFSSVNDQMFYISKSRNYLEGKKLPIVNKDAVGDVKFKMTNGKIVTQKLSGLTWAIILFNGKTNPVIADMVSIEKEYEKVFGK